MYHPPLICDYFVYGQRTLKYTNNTDTFFTYAGDILAGQKTGDNVLVWMYDNNGTYIGFTYNGTEYYYVYNLQGDVVALANSTSTIIARYTYGPWGTVDAVTDNLGNDISGNATHIANINPIRYRGYYYDVETGFYYLNSRYYDPEICRFINADSQLNISQSVLGTNMLAYCLNNPINKSDYYGNKPNDLFDTMDEAAKDAARYLWKLSLDTGWEYASTIYTVKKTYMRIKLSYKTIKIVKIKIKIPLITIQKQTVTKYTYTKAKTDKSKDTVDPPNAPSGKERLAAVHTHPNQGGFGVTMFSGKDIIWSKKYNVIIYVYGPDEKLWKYDPKSGKHTSIK